MYEVELLVTNDVTFSKHTKYSQMKKYKNT